MAKKSKELDTITLAQLSNRYLAHMEEAGKSDTTRFSYLMELKVAQAELGADTLLAALTSDAIATFNASDRVTKMRNGKAKSQLSIDKTRRVLRLALTWAHATGLMEDAIVEARRDQIAERIVPLPDVASGKGKRVKANATSADATLPIATDATAPKRARAKATSAETTAPAATTPAPAAKRSRTKSTATTTSTDATPAAPTADQPVAKKRGRKQAITLEVGQAAAEQAADAAEAQLDTNPAA